MKKAILCAILLCLILAACTAVTEQPVTTIATTAPYVSSLITPQGYGIALVPKPGPYVMKEMDGQFYVDFGEGNQRVPIENTGCVRYVGLISRKSIDELYDSLMTGSFTMDELQLIRAFFDLEPGVGFRLPNPKDLYTLKMPERMRASINLYAGGYSYNISNGSVPLREAISGTFRAMEKSEFEAGVASLSEFDLVNNETLSSTPLPERNATIYDINKPNGDIDRYVRYTYQSGETVLHVREEYPRYDRDGDADIGDLLVYGMVNGEYCYMRFGQYPGVPTVDWLLQFQKIPYTPQ